MADISVNHTTDCCMARTTYYSSQGRPSQGFGSIFYYFSCRDGVYACAVPIYSGGKREALCRIDETNKMVSGDEAISRSFKTIFFSFKFYDQKTPSWNSELKEVNLGNTRPRKKVDMRF